MAALLAVSAWSCKRQSFGADVQHVLVDPGGRFSYVVSVTRVNGQLDVQASTVKIDYPLEVVGASKSRISLKWLHGIRTIELDGDDVKCRSESTRGGEELKVDHTCQVLSADEYRELMDAPQTPAEAQRGPSTAVRFTSANGVLDLSGTLVVPTGPGPFPSAVLLSGSGWDNRDYKQGEHRPFLVLAHHLAQNGVATLRFDDPRKLENANLDDLADHARGAITFLRKQERIDPASTGLLGHSEGANVATLAATSMSPQPQFVIQLGAPTASPETTARFQAKMRGESPARVEASVLLERTLAEFATADGDEQVRTVLRRATARLEAIEGLDDRERAGFRAALSNQALMARVSSGHKLGIRPASTVASPGETLARFEGLVLAVWGADEKAVPPKESLAAVVEARRGKPKQATVTAILPGLDHNLRDAARADRHTIAPEALSMISDWIRELPKQPAKPSNQASVP